MSKVFEKIKELFYCGSILLFAFAIWLAERFDKDGLSLFDDYCDDYLYCGEQDEK